MNRFRKNQPKNNENRVERPKPLRQFNDDSRQAAGNKGGAVGWRGKLFLSWLVGIFGVVAVLALGGFVFLDLNDGADVPETVDERPAVSTSTGEISPSELTEAYIDAMGGRDALRQIRSVGYEGRVVFETSENDFQMYLLMPDKGMLVINPGERNSQKLMLNGDVAWQVVEMPDGTTEARRLGNKEVQSLKWSMRVHNSFREIALNGRASELELREIEYSGRPCFEASRESADGSSFSAVLDRESLYLLKIVETVSRGEKSDTFTVLYDDYRMVSGVVEPYHTKLYRNGSLDNEVMVESIRINSGVMSSLFKVPDEFLD
jgi:hypothetical protein